MALDPQQIVCAGLLIVACILASFTQGKDRDATVLVAFGVAVNWWLWLWAFLPWSASQAIFDVTGQVVMPRLLWLCFDFTLSLCCALVFYRTRANIAAVVGVLLWVQVGIEMATFNHKWATIQPVMDLLWEAQLLALAFNGGKSVGQRIWSMAVDLFGRNMGSSSGASRPSRHPLSGLYIVSGEHRDTRHAVSAEQRGDRG